MQSNSINMFNLAAIYSIVILVLVLLATGSSSSPSTNDFAEFDDELDEAPLAAARPHQADSRVPGAGSPEPPPTKPPPPHSDHARPTTRDPAKPEPDHLKPDGGRGEPAEQAKPEPPPALKLVNAPLAKVYKIESYYIEFAFIFASLLYIANYFVGSSKNHKLARLWYLYSQELLKQQFSLVGGAPTLGDNNTKKVAAEDEAADATLAALKKQRGLIKASESVYTLWCSGRLGMDGVLVEINLLKRQDLFSMALALLKPTRDTLLFRFLLNNEGYENFVFSIAHKSQATKLVRQQIDINTFCPKRKPISQCGVDSERLFVMSELGDVTSFVLDDTTSSFLKKYEQAINFIHITDQYSTSRADDATPAQKLANTKRMATFSFALPTDSCEANEFLNFALYLLARLKRYKLPKDSKQKSDKSRQKITDILQKKAFLERQEALQNKKEELRRQEKERIYSEDDPEKQRRWEKKEAKRELKKNKMRVKQLKVKSMA